MGGESDAGIWLSRKKLDLGHNNLIDKSLGLTETLRAFKALVENSNRECEPDLWS